MLLLLRLAWIAAASCGWRLTRIFPRYRPVAWTLSAGLGLEILRSTIKLSLDGPRPFTGWARLLFHIDQGAVLAFPALSVWLALRVLTELRAVGAVGGAWFGLMLAATIGYPELRGHAWLAVVEQASVVAVALQALLMAFALRRAMATGGIPPPPVRACLVLLAGDGAQLFGPWLGAPAEHWGIWRLQATITLGTLALLEARWTAARTPAAT